MNPFYLTAFLPVILGIAVLLGVLLFYRRKLGRTRSAMEELAHSVNGVLSRRSMFSGDILDGRHNGIPFSCRYFPGSKNSPPSLTIQMGIPSPAKLIIRREAWYDRFAKRIGLVAELQTGDPVFDQAYFLETDRGDIILPYFAQETKRRSVDALSHMGYPVQKIVFGKDGLRIVFAPFPPDAIASFPLAQCLSEAQNLSGEQSSAGYAASFDRRLFPGNPRQPISRGILTLLFILNGFLIPAGAFLLAYGMSEHEPLGHHLIVNALSLSVVAVLFYLLIVFRWIRGRSSSHRYYLIILILSFLGFPLALTGGAVATNGIFDQGKETSRSVQVSNLYYHQSKNSRTYYVAFPSWQRPGETENVSIPDNLYRVLKPTSEIIIKTKPGYWREEWIAGMEPSSKSIERPDVLALHLRKIRFYEGGAARVPDQEKRFATEFARETTRYIHCQVNMENDYWNIREQSYNFVWKYINPDGSLRGEVSLPFTVRREWRSAWVVSSWGWENSGNWPAGNYRVSVYVDDSPFGEGNFIIR